MGILSILLGLAIFVALINVSFYLRKLNETANDIRKLLKDKNK